MHFSFAVLFIASSIALDGFAVSGVKWNGQLLKTEATGGERGTKIGARWRVNGTGKLTKGKEVIIDFFDADNLPMDLTKWTKPVIRKTSYTHGRWRVQLWDIEYMLDFYYDSFDWGGQLNITVGGQSRMFALWMVSNGSDTVASSEDMSYRPAFGNKILVKYTRKIEGMSWIKLYTSEVGTAALIKSTQDWHVKLANGYFKLRTLERPRVNPSFFTRASVMSNICVQMLSQMEYLTGAVVDGICNRFVDAVIDLFEKQTKRMTNGEILERGKKERGVLLLNTVKQNVREAKECANVKNILKYGVAFTCQQFIKCHITSELGHFEMFTERLVTTICKKFVEEVSNATQKVKDVLIGRRYR